jgi:hypothetical protein
MGFARNIHMGMTCSRDRAALPTGFPEKTQFVHPGSFGALPRREFWGIGEGDPWFFSNAGCKGEALYRLKRLMTLKPAFLAR